MLIKFKNLTKILQGRKGSFSDENKSALILLGLIWAVFIGILICVVLYISTGERFTIIRLISYLGPWLAGLLFFLIVVSALMRKKIIAISMFVLAVLISIPYVRLFVPSSTEPTLGQQIYKVMTYSKMGRNHDISSVAKVVSSEKPDLLFMQEIDKQESEKLIQLLSRTYTGSTLFYLIDKGLILSHYKIRTRHHNKTSYSKSAEIDFPEMSILGWNVHLQKSVVNTDVQYKMTNQLVEEVSLVQSPVILAGDFNATMLNYPYRKIKRNLNLNNAFEQSGFGFGFTFPTPARRLGLITPFMRIDHIFFNDYFNIHDAYVVNESGGSDHYPVVALFSLNTIPKQKS